MNGKYTEQIDRVLRSYDSLGDRSLLFMYNRISDEYKETEEVDSVLDNDVMDSYLIFFVLCHCIKDWLINDEEVELENKVKLLEKHVTQNVFLKYTASIANATKHLILTRNGRNIVDVSIIVDPKDKSVNVQSDEEGLRFSAFELATGALDSWKTFLSLHEIESSLTKRDFSDKAGLRFHSEQLYLRRNQSR